MTNFYRLLLLCLMFAYIPVMAAEATAPVHACSTIKSVKYTKADVIEIQQNLAAIYHADAAWIKQKAASTAPLSDGVLGPITLGWIHRFCADYALDLSTDLASELLSRSTAIAAFAEKHANEHGILLSADFAKWRSAAKDSNAISLVLLNGSNEALLALVRRYLARNQPQPAAAAAPTEKNKPNTIYQYVLTASDIAKLQEPVVLPDIVKKLADQTFATKDDANKAIKKAMTPVPKDQQAQAVSVIQENLSEQAVYQFTEANISALTGLTAPQIVALNKIPKTPVVDEEEFRQLVQTALVLPTTATSVEPAAPVQQANTVQDASAAQPASSTPSTQSGSSEVLTNAVAAPLLDADEIEVALIRILNATKASRFYFPPGVPAQILGELTGPNPRTSVNPLAVKALSSLVDVDYPESELFHRAAQDKLTRLLAVCDQTSSNGRDKMLPSMTQAEVNQLRDWLKPFSEDEDTHLLLQDRETKPRLPICGPSVHKDIRAAYDKALRLALDTLLRKEAPAYKGADIHWSGAACGCVPKQMTSIAYGILPWWQSGGEVPTNLDFSTLARVAYYALSFDSAGSLTQPNTHDQNATLFNPAAKLNRDFIEEARNYGAKFDWVIEKDFSTGEDVNTAKSSRPLEAQLAGLSKSIVNLLTTPLTAKHASLRTWLSFGVTLHPTYGDGVTLYFKHYPQDDASKKVFEHFFKDLKGKLKKISEDRSRFQYNKDGYYLNLIINKDDYQNPAQVMSAANVFKWLDIDLSLKSKFINSTQLEQQHITKTLLLVLLDDPYVSSMTDLYNNFVSTSRGYLLPIAFVHYRDFQREELEGGKNLYDERRKMISFQNEAFGGGGFWWAPKYEDRPFDSYLADEFSLGYDEHSAWYNTLCGYRWAFISVMNVWLCIALLYVILGFYVFPHQCYRLPPLLEKCLSPPIVVITVAPPLAICVYLLAIDPTFPALSVPVFLALVLIFLNTVAGVRSVQALKQRKPQRVRL